MAPIDLMLIATGGFFGAIFRYSISRKYNREDGLPFGTLICNGIGSFLLGLLFGFDVGTKTMQLVGIGFLGSFTTFSTFVLELLTLWTKTERARAVLYLFGSVVGSLILTYIGYEVGFFLHR